MDRDDPQPAPMSLKPGARLGPYEVLSLLGVGGMGEVYRAHDPRLDRTVAIKVLPPHLAVTRESRARFEREARAVAGLNHPHICVLYDVGREGDLDYLVMELVDGETLAARLERGRLPVDTAMKLAAEIASALEKAHRAGIVHRDLKPSNIMMTVAGAKLMDFGLARRSSNADADPNRSTQTALTTQGTLAGTLPYMAPEQVVGGEADERSDLWALGCVLYEMVTGKPAFDGNGPAATLGMILNGAPSPMIEVEPSTPDALERVVRQGLAKEPDERWQSAGDLRRELEWILGRDVQTGPRPAAVRRRSVVRPWIWVGMAGLLGLLTWAWLPRIREHRRSEPLKLTVLPPEGPFTFEFPGLAPPALSPSGRQMVFGALDSSGRQRLWLRTFDSFESRILPGTEGATFPFWSPDEHSIGFFAGGKVKRIEVAGGPAQALADCSEDPRGGTWARNRILFAPDANSGLFVVPEGGGRAVAVTIPNPSLPDISYRFPVFLPDGDHYLFLVHSNARRVRDSVGGIYIGSLRTGQTRRIVSDLSTPAWMPGDYLLFVRDRALVALPFDSRRLATTGTARVIAPDVEYWASMSLGVFSAAPSGALAYRGGAASKGRRLLWLDRSGNVIDSLGAKAHYGSVLRLSADGRRLAVILTEGSGGADVWIWDLANEVPMRVTFWPSDETGPAWSPDGERLLFESDSSGTRRLYMESLSGNSDPLRIADVDGSQFSPDWAPDGRTIAFVLDSQRQGKTASEIWIRSDDGRSRVFLKGEAFFTTPRFSPDGKWMAYASDESGHDEVYVCGFPDPGGRWQVSSAGGTEPHWKSDGREIAYRGPAGEIIAVSIRLASGVTVGVPHRLFALPADDVWEATPDHSRFLVSRSEGQQEPVRVVLGWGEGQKRDW